MEQLFELAAFGAINDDDLAEAILIQALEPVRKRRKVDRKLEKFNIDKLSSDECRDMFRFGKEDIPLMIQYFGLPDFICCEESRLKVSAIEGMCIFLRRMAYPDRLCDLATTFGRSPSYISRITNKVLNLVYTNKGHLLHNLESLSWLNQEKMNYYAKAVSEKGSPIKNCWGIIGSTERPICRPTVGQKDYISGHNRHHCLKYQSVMCPDGIIAHLSGPHMGKRHDAEILQESDLLDQLERKAKFPGDEKFVIYGDPTYPLRELLMCPFSEANITNRQKEFNKRMSVVRQAVEWGFEKVVNHFAYSDYKKNQKFLLNNIGEIYTVSVILANCHTCLYGSQTTSYFGLQPPDISTYLKD